ncbi:MAG: hypothetical protein ACREBR_05565 [bacterium]
MEEMFDDLSLMPQPKNTITLTLKNADGSIDKEVTVENTVCTIAASRANMWYKLTPVGGFNYEGLSNPYPGDGNGLYLTVMSYNPGVTGGNYYLNTYPGFYPFYAPNDAIDSTQSSTFYVYNVIDATHLYVLNGTANALMQAGDTITQGVNSTTITSVVDANHIQVGSTSGWVGQLNDTRIWTAWNLNNAISTSGTADGIYLPQSSGAQRNRGFKWTYEWGTTQGNGTLSSVAFQHGNNTPSISGQGTGYIKVGVTPELNLNQFWQYAGWKTVGGARQLYFVNKAVSNNNVTIVNYSDFSLVSQETITNPTVAAFGSVNHDIIYTPVGGGNFYAIVSTAAHTFTYRKAAESGSMTFGAPVTTATFSVPGWPAGGTVNFENWTADQSFIYAMVYDNSNTQRAILKYDPSTDTVVSITKLPAGLAGAGGGIYVRYMFNICPVTGKLFLSQSGYYVCEWPDITQPGQQRQVSTLQDGNPTYYYPTFMMEQNTDRLVWTYYQFNGNNSFSISQYGAWYEMTKGEFVTYAELPSTLVKGNTQSLVVSYTLNFA